MAVKNLAGQRVGKLLILDKTYANDGTTMWRCQCDCGTVKAIRASRLVAGNPKSCGCVKVKHGLLKNYEYPAVYRRWVAMISRCKETDLANYSKYAGQGVSVDPRWTVFENFYADMGDLPFPHARLHRIDKSGNYSKENCRWATASENSRSTRRVKLSVEIVEEIRNSGDDDKKIAERYDITPKYVRTIRQYKVWK